MLAACFLFTLISPANGQDRDRDPCARNLKTIWDAVQKYREEHKKLPVHLSELVPNFVSSPAAMICPVTRRTGEIKNNGFSDPKLSSSYIYEFGSFPVPGFEDAGFTLRDWRQLQMGQVGSIVPVLRCLHHARVLNISFDGNVYETAGEWETELANVVDPGSLSPRNMLAEVEFFATGIRIARIKTVDLSGYYNVKLTDVLHDTNPNGPSLRNFPEGLNKFLGIPFEVSGAIHLHGTGLNNIFPDRYPTNVTEIAINQPAEKVHFLLGAGYNMGSGGRVGTITVHYEDGESTDIELLYDVQLRDWWQNFPEGNTTLRIAWSGLIGPDLQGGPQSGRVYMFSWDNIRPQTPIKSLDFLSALNSAAPFLLGVSVETP